MSGKFKDSTGHEWEWPSFTIRSVNRIRDEHKLNLRDLLKRDNEEAALRLSDDEAVFAIFCDLCSEQVKASGVSVEDLQGRWDENTVPAAKDALLERFFTFSQGAKKAKAIMEQLATT